MTQIPLTTDTTNDDTDEAEKRLANYLARTGTPLDLLALVTLWIVLIPPNDFGSTDDVQIAAIAVRIGVSVIYGIDIAIRSALARRHLHYLRTHPLAIASVIFPPVRVVLSLRLVRSVFQRGNLGRFLLAASILVLNGAVIVYFVERHARGGNIHTLGESVWWSIVTVTTVGYGDFYPVTLEGRITAGFIMGVGILTLAVVTAQVASSFVADRSEKGDPQPSALESTATTSTEIALLDLDKRLARMEETITVLANRLT